MRGKHGAQAERRREVVEAAATIESYQRANARLAAENKALRQSAAETEAALRGEVRALKAHLREGLSPELSALRQTVDRLRDERDAARRDARQTREKWERAISRMHSYVQQVEGGTNLESLERLGVVLGIDAEVATIDTVGLGGTVDSVRAIQRSRGERGRA